MAKISDLVKTYRLLSDPNAPDWNVKFIGGVAVALALVVAAGAVVWNAAREPEGPAQAPAAATAQEPGDLTSCEPTEVAQELQRLGRTSLPKGYRLPSGCVIG